MEIVKQWIVNGYQHLVLLDTGNYMIGSTSDVYGYARIRKEKAIALICEAKHQIIINKCFYYKQT